MRKKTSNIVWQDTQHQELFDILELVKAPESGAEILTKLRDYTHSHFMLEERYMVMLEYPEREEHIQAHTRFREEIDQLLSNDQSHDPQFREIIATFLTEWLTRHVLGIDKKLEEFIARSDIK